MAKISLLRVLLNERLTAAADEIIGAVEKTVAEYQEEITRSKEENEKLRKLLDIVLKPVIKLHRADLQQLTLPVSEKVPPEQQHCEEEWSPSLGMEDPEPTQIYEQELRTSHGREHLHALESKDPNVIFTIACVKSLCQNQDSTKPSHIYQTKGEEYGQGASLPSTSTEQIKTEPDGDGYMSLEPTSEPQLRSVFNHCSAVQCENSVILSVDRLASGELPSGSKPPESKRARCQVCDCCKVKSTLVKHQNIHIRENGAMKWQQDRGPAAATASQSMDSTLSPPPSRRPAVPRSTAWRQKRKGEEYAHAQQQGALYPKRSDVYRSKVHPDISIPRLTPEYDELLTNRSGGRPDRYAVLLFRACVTEERYREWEQNTNWDGSRGKFGLPVNLRMFIRTTVSQKFPSMSDATRKNIKDRVNEYLRSPRKSGHGLLSLI
ncbi:uncharacterized protein LOC121550324 isoform X1 [Coregonus clupeaformis]|uniref:uncharacterized protein LOC121550324 isoform X1 n=1 Tax=Coregonus clupeaformis TaxID=59861 RepID=UPI001E1C5B7A|nr:uncharacterized protein LOC121550324 isoform X1 [Coregonus clupeaformis]